MARRKKTRREQEETILDIVEAKEQAQGFLEENQNIVLGVVAGILLIVGGIFAYKYFYKMPREAEAGEQIYQAELQFERDSFELALLNPGGGYLGFLDIIDTYGGTDVANLANYYAGICYLNLGKFEAAQSYLEDFSPSGRISPIMKFGALGDALSEQGRLEQAASAYRKAANAGSNEFLTPYYLKKLGLLYEDQGEYQDAIKVYEEIKSKYANSIDGRTIDKYISNAKVLQNQS
ncbi:MAG: tetratricopeptide repeat protein [Saprospiraceae bacterium]|nr:tetratricopeptide repeat protein [Saprospiraceae bacterium]